MILAVAVVELIILYLGMDASLRPGPAAKSIAPGEEDRRSTYWVGGAQSFAVLSLGLAVLLNHWGIGRLAGVQWTGWLGLGLMVLAVGLRFWAMRVLGRFFTRTLLTTSDQQIVTGGPYRIIRHPGYAASILLWTAAGLATGNWIVFVLIFLADTAAYAYRIKSEEAMLIGQFGSRYRDYIQNTWRIIPYIY